MSDQLIRAISRDGLIKVSAVSTRDLTERARQIHKTLPVATAALGRLLAAASMMGNALKEEAASLTLQIKGGGPLGTLLAVSDHEGNVRGTVDNPAVDLPLREDGKLDVGAAVGNRGTLTVIRDLRMKEPYVGSVGLLWGRSPRTSPCTSWRASRFPRPAAWGCWWTGTKASWRRGGILSSSSPARGTRCPRSWRPPSGRRGR